MDYMKFKQELVGTCPDGRVKDGDVDDCDEVGDRDEERTKKEG